MKIIELYGMAPTKLQRVNWPKKEFVAGVELEIEAVRGFEDDSRLHARNIMMIEDGSLRNNGREFLLSPGYIPQLMDDFAFIHKNCRFGKEKFSSRTSIHVHVNMLGSTEAEAKTFLGLYSIFEPYFFAFAGSDRRENIHCVPLGYTHMPTVYGQPIRTLVPIWHKYTAFNLAPLGKYGTIEFRHLAGTDNAVVFQTWLELIKRLWEFAHADVELNAPHLINLAWLREVHNQLITPDVVKHSLETINFVLEDNLLDIKLAYI